MRVERTAVAVTVAAGIAGAASLFLLAPAALAAVAIDAYLLRDERRSKIIWASFAAALALLAYGTTVFTFGD